MGLDREPGGIGSCLRGLRAEAGDRSRLEVAGPHPAHAALVGHVAEHRARSLERTRQGSTLGVVERVLLPARHEPQRDDRHVPHLASVRALRRRSRQDARPRTRRDRRARNARDLTRAVSLSERHGRRRLRVVLGDVRRRHLAALERRPRARDELLDRLLEGGGVDEHLLHEHRARDRRGDVTTAHEAILAVRREELHHDRLELFGEIAPIDARRLDLAGTNDGEERLSSEPAVERSAREALPEDHAERVEVAPSIDLLSACLLGGHVPELALEDASLLVDEACARDPEVRDLHDALVGEEDVLRRDVTMDDVERRTALVALLVCVVEALRRLGDDPRRDPWRDARCSALRRAHEMAEVASLDVLHREDVPVVALVGELVDLDDVGVVQACRELRLVDEHRAKATRRRVRGQDALDDDDLVGALGTTLLGEEDLRHPARPEPAHGLELRDLDRDWSGARHLGVPAILPQPWPVDRRGAVLLAHRVLRPSPGTGRPTPVDARWEAR